MQPSSIASAVAAAAAILLITLPEARGIRCYECNSKVDTGCEDLPAVPSNATIPLDSPFLKTCKKGPEGEDPFCRKSVIKVLNVNEGNGEVRWVRACGWIKYKRECYKYDDSDHQEIVCQCFTDGCNAAQPPASSSPLHLLLPALAAALAAMQR